MNGKHPWFWLALLWLGLFVTACGDEGSSPLPDRTDGDEMDKESPVADREDFVPEDGDKMDDEPFEEEPPEDGDLPDGDEMDDEPFEEEPPEDGDLPDGDEMDDEPFEEEPPEDGDLPDGDTPDLEPENCPDLTCIPGTVDECHYYDTYQGFDGCPRCRYNTVQNEQACRNTTTGLCYGGNCYTEWGDLNCEDQAESCPDDSACREFELHEQTLVYCAYCEEIWPREGGPCFTASNDPGQCFHGDCVEWIFPDGDLEEADADLDEDLPAVDGDADLDDDPAETDTDETSVVDGDTDPEIIPCVPGRKRCYPGDTVSYQTCLPNGTWGTAVVCNDQVECSTDICFGPGLCGSDGVNVGASCDDFNGQTIDDTCMSDGTCRGTWVPLDGDEELDEEEDEEEWCQFGAECCEDYHCVEIYGPGYFCEPTTLLCAAENPICEPYDEICCKDDPANIEGCLALGSDMIRAFATCSSTGGSWDLQTSQMCSLGQGCDYNQYDSAICVSGMCADNSECDPPAVCSAANRCEIPILSEGQVCDENGLPTGACDIGLHCCIGDDMLGTCEIACGGDDPDWEPIEEGKRKIPVKKGRSLR